MSSRLTFGTLKRIGAILIAIMIVIAAGIVVGQAPAIFGVEEDPEASITFEDQQGNGSTVTVQSVTLSEGGYVVISDGGDEPLAVSERLEAGSHENVTLEREDDATRELLGQRPRRFIGTRRTTKGTPTRRAAARRISPISRTGSRLVTPRR